MMLYLLNKQINIRPHSGRFFIFGHSPKHYWLSTSALGIGLPAMHLLLATRKRVSPKPPLCKGRWHFRKKMTEGLSRKSALSLPANFSKRHNPSPASQELPLHKGAFPIMPPSTKSPHPLFLFTGKPLLNHATIAWFSFAKEKGATDIAPLWRFLFDFFLQAGW